MLVFGASRPGCRMQPVELFRYNFVTGNVRLLSFVQLATEKGIRIKLGFFLYIPFPPWDIFRLLPWANQVLEGLLGYDMVGFHIELLTLFRRQTKRLAFY
ncbi:hypothetical protein OUZ56_012878 [Daphnia magna]|uniref:Uncharacterized protein n=1 Tax=Daphnia magna TaxID=35525 RepID=A0ABQ9Z4A7_9CRUS|nr:hypothetical protein OUZ56_012878 [Daphnia magna]